MTPEELATYRADADKGMLFPGEDVIKLLDTLETVRKENERMRERLRWLDPPRGEAMLDR